MRVTSTPARLSRLAANRPPKPEPTTTTWWRRAISVMWGLLPTESSTRNYPRRPSGIPDRDGRYRKSIPLGLHASRYRRQLPGLGHFDRDLAHAAVQVLAGRTQLLEGLLGGEQLARH